MAGLVGKGGSSPFCGGAVINNLYVLTAAHCVDDKSAGSIQVLLADHDMPRPDGQQRFNVQHIRLHPAFGIASWLSYDLALLRLTTFISFADNRIAPVCLASIGDFGDVSAVITGWGTTSEGGSQPSKLWEVTVHTMTNSQCSMYGTVPFDMLCAGVSGGGKDSCQGDSGGLMVTEIANDRYCS